MYRVTGDFHSRPLSWISTVPEHVFVVGNLSSTATGPGNGLIGVRPLRRMPARSPARLLCSFVWPRMRHAVALTRLCPPHARPPIPTIRHRAIEAHCVERVTSQRQVGRLLAF